MSFANCLNAAGYSIECSGSGGINKVWLASFDDTITYTFGTNSVIEGFSSTQSFYQMQQVSETADASAPSTKDKAAGTVVYEQTLIITFHKLTAATKNLIKLLHQGRHVAVVLDNNGTYHLFGRETGLDVSGGTNTLGKELGSLNGSEVTLVSRSANLPDEINQTLAQFNLIDA